MPLRALIAALVLAVSYGQALATDPVGYGEAFDTLYRVDLATHTAQEIGRATPLGSPRLANVEGLTFSPDGKLYAVSDADTLKTLLSIDPITGLATSIAALNLAGQNVNGQLDLGLAFTCDGKLWLSSGTGMFWQVNNPSTGTTTYIGNLGVKITGLTAQGNVLYGTGSQGDNHLYQIDPLTAKTTLIGAYGPAANYITTTSPGFDASGQLWAILDYVPPPSGSEVAPWSDLVQIETGSATLANLGSITAPQSSQSAADLEFIGLKGLAIAPSVCATTGSVASTPALSWRAMAALIALLMLFAGTRLRRCRQTF